VAQAEAEAGVSLLAERHTLQMRLLSALVEWYGWDENTTERRLRAASDLMAGVRPSGTDAVMHFISTELSKEVYISLMDQYFPAYKAHNIPELSRRITKEEYDRGFNQMTECGLENGWVQEHIEA
jgi:hypothetical protein